MYRRLSSSAVDEARLWPDLVPCWQRTPQSCSAFRIASARASASVRGVSSKRGSISSGIGATGPRVEPLEPAAVRPQMRVDLGLPTAFGASGPPTPCREMGRHARRSRRASPEPLTLLPTQRPAARGARIPPRDQPRGGRSSQPRRKAPVPPVRQVPPPVERARAAGGCAASFARGVRILRASRAAGETCRHARRGWRNMRVAGTTARTVGLRRASRRRPSPLDRPSRATPSARRSAARPRLTHPTPPGGRIPGAVSTVHLS